MDAGWKTDKKTIVPSDTMGTNAAMTSGVCRVRVVYVDTLFLFNFAVNRLLLEGTRQVLRSTAKRRRLTLGALLGAAYAVWCVVQPHAFLHSVPMRLAAGALMVMVAFGKGSRAHVVKCCLAFFCLSAGVGGAVFGLYYLLGNGSDFALLNGIAYLDLPLGTFLLFFLLALPACLFGYRLFTVGEGVTQRRLQVTLTAAGKTLSATALLDTGCSLREPLSGRPAIVVQRSLLFDFPVDRDRPPPGTLWLPFATIGSKGLLPAVRGQRLSWQQGDKTVVHTDFYVALAEAPLCPDGSFQILLPHTLAAGGDTHQKKEVSQPCP